MHEHIARTLYYLQVHLLYASVVGLAALILTSIARASATTKYWIWVVTALNFIFPLAAMLDKIWAPHLSWATPLSVIGVFGNAIVENTGAAAVLGTIWLLGATTMLGRLGLRLWAERRHTQASAAATTALEREQDFLAQGVPVRFAATRQTPAVEGVLHPHISLPHGIDRLLSQPELNAVLLHELTHARRRDNLIRLIHELGLCVLWFHPLVWVTGSRLALYRELSCDESVMQHARGGDLVSALAKIANSDDALLLQASASSFLSHRLARLSATQSQPSCLVVNALLAAMFGAALLAGIFATVAHTACCFVLRT